MTTSRLSAEDATQELKAWLVTVPAGRARSLLDAVTKAAASTGASILVVEADMVFGVDHLRSALYHAKRALNEGSNTSDSLAMETLLYASGERQLSTAIRKMSVGDQTERVVIAQLSGDVIAAADWKILQDVPDAISPARLGRFGISETELATIGQRPPEELVLERVAAVDLLKK